MPSLDSHWSWARGVKEVLPSETQLGGGVAYGTLNRNFRPNLVLELS